MCDFSGRLVAWMDRELPDNDAVRGMLKAVNFLVAVEGTPYVRPKRSKYKIWRKRSDKKHQRGR